MTWQTTISPKMKKSTEIKIAPNPKNDSIFTCFFLKKPWQYCDKISEFTFLFTQKAVKNEQNSVKKRIFRGKKSLKKRYQLHQDGILSASRPNKSCIKTQFEQNKHKKSLNNRSY